MFNLYGNDIEFINNISTPAYNTDFYLSDQFLQNKQDKILRKILKLQHRIYSTVQSKGLHDQKIQRDKPSKNTRRSIINQFHQGNIQLNQNIATLNGALGNDMMILSNDFINSISPNQDLKTTIAKIHLLNDIKKISSRTRLRMRHRMLQYHTRRRVRILKQLHLSSDPIRNKHRLLKRTPSQERFKLTHLHHLKKILRIPDHMNRTKELQRFHDSIQRDTLTPLNTLNVTIHRNRFIRSLYAYQASTLENTSSQLLCLLTILYILVMFIVSKRF